MRSGRALQYACRGRGTLQYHQKRRPLLLDTAARGTAASAMGRLYTHPRGPPPQQQHARRPTVEANRACRTPPASRGFVNPGPQTSRAATSSRGPAAATCPGTSRRCRSSRRAGTLSTYACSPCRRPRACAASSAPAPSRRRGTRRPRLLYQKRAPGASRGRRTWRATISIRTRATAATHAGSASSRRSGRTLVVFRRAPPRLPKLETRPGPPRARC
mmetsp:Transcript_22113/g.67813  ORF Transcript_22113/g.67813 Transcript_22113/m.67813 type:complete len:217 (-) Transcript_22113:3-653(-)